MQVSSGATGTTVTHNGQDISPTATTTSTSSQGGTCQFDFWDLSGHGGGGHMPGGPPGGGPSGGPPRMGQPPGSGPPSSAPPMGGYGPPGSQPPPGVFMLGGPPHP